MSGTWISTSAGHATTPVIGAHTDGDWLVLEAETQSGALTAPAGWTKRWEVPNGAGTTQHTGWIRKVGVGETVADPTISGGTDHTWAQVSVYRGLDPNDPILDIAFQQTVAAATLITLPGAWIKGQANTLIKQGFAYQIDAASAGSSAWTNGTLSGFTMRRDDGTTTAGGGGLAMATGTLAAADAFSGFATVTVSSLQFVGVCIAFRNAPAAGTFIAEDAAGIRINGAPAPDGGNVDVIDWTRAIELGVIETSVTLANGDGTWSALVREPTHQYRGVYDSGSSRGCSPLSLPEAP